MTDFAPRDIRIGIVGLGLMGERHCRIVSALSGPKLVAVCDHHEKLATETAKLFDATAFTDFAEMLKSDLMDAVVICLPSSMHAAYGTMAAVAGKHVIMEKPIHSQSAPAQELKALCDGAGVVCAVISQNRFSPGIRAIKQVLSSGEFGTPVMARATVKWFRHDDYYTGSHWRGRREGEHGGVLINQAVHSIDILQWLFGIPDYVAGFIHNSRPDVLETEDTAAVVFKWKSGLIATLEACTAAAPGFDETYEIQSRIASIRVVKGQLTDWYHADGLPAPLVEQTQIPDGLDQKLSLFYAQYLNIMDAIAGRDRLVATPDEAVEVVETIEKIYRSASVCQAIRKDS